MAKKLLLLLILGLLGLFTSLSHATTIHLRYFESADFFLIDGRFQIYSFAALEGETVTLVVYGLDEGLSPTVSVFDINGVTVAEDLNSAQGEVAVVELTASANGLYTALVSRQSETGGLVRLMLFEGDPLASDDSFLDTLDPLLPSRAYFVQGDSQNALSMTVAVLDDDDSRTPLTRIFASRGTDQQAPPMEERSTAIERFTWQNNEGAVFYTLNVRPSPEASPPTSRKVGGFLSNNAQFLGLASIRVDIGAGSGDPIPDYLPRLECLGQAPAGVTLRAGPGEQFVALGTLSQETQVEVIGASGDFWLVIDPNSSVGGSFISQEELQITTGENACARVLPDFTAPDETPDNTIESPARLAENAPFNPLAGLPPDGGNPPDSPTENKTNETTQDVVRVPPPPTGPNEPELPLYPSAGCLLFRTFPTGYFNFLGGFSLAPLQDVYDDPTCTTIVAGFGASVVYAPAPYDPAFLCNAAFPGTTPIFLGMDVFICS